jgi:hypothetical protein
MSELIAIVASMKGVCHASFSTIRKFPRDVIQVTVSRCQLAKLIRDVKFLLTLSDRVTRNYARRLLDALRKLFRVIHRRNPLDSTTL